MESKALPLPHARGWGLIALLWLLLLLLGGAWIKGQAFTLGTYLIGLGLGGATLAWLGYLYRLYALIRLRYRVDRNGLYVRWGLGTFVLPMRYIHDVQRPGVRAHLSRRWWRLPAPFVGEWILGKRRLVTFSTRPLDRMWFFCGPDLCLGISPADGEAFLAALRQRRRLGATRELAPGWQYPSLLHARLFQDGVALTTLLGSALLLLLLWGAAAARSSLIEVVRTTRMVTFLAAVDGGLGALFYRRERFPALIIWWTGAAVVAIFLVHLWVGS